MIWANVSFEEEDQANNPVHAEIRLDGARVGTVQQSNIEIDGFFASESIANAVATPVTSGAHTLTLYVDSVEGTEIVIEDRSILAMYIPE